MFYIPLSATVVYLYIAAKLSKNIQIRPRSDVLNKTMMNLMLTEIVFVCLWLFDYPTSESFSLIRLILFYLIQDAYYYGVHRYLMHSSVLERFHNVPPEPLTYYSAWYRSSVEHIVLNLFSVIIPMWIVPNSTLVMYGVFLQQTFMSIYYCRLYARCSLYISNSNTEIKSLISSFGTLGIVDYFLG